MRSEGKIEVDTTKTKARADIDRSDSKVYKLTFQGLKWLDEKTSLPEGTGEKTPDKPLDSSPEDRLERGLGDRYDPFSRDRGELDGTHARTVKIPIYGAPPEDRQPSWNPDKSQANLKNGLEIKRLEIGRNKDRTMMIEQNQTPEGPKSLVLKFGLDAEGEDLENLRERAMDLAEEIKGDFESMGYQLGAPEHTGIEKIEIQGDMVAEAISGQANLSLYGMEIDNSPKDGTLHFSDYETAKAYLKPYKYMAEMDKRIKELQRNIKQYMEAQTELLEGLNQASPGPGDQGSDPGGRMYG